MYRCVPPVDCLGPDRVFFLRHEDPTDALGEWLAGIDSAVSWYIGSVNRAGTTRLLEWQRTHRPQDRVVLLTYEDVPIDVRIPDPDMVGIDRLLDAAAADRLRSKGVPAVVVDLGTAITVDLVSADGGFLGGAILPGLAMAARALHEYTDLLPLIDVAEFDAPPDPLGTSTEAAMSAGLFWGPVGGVRELVARHEERLAAKAEIFVTGGNASQVVEALGERARLVPDLTLAGTAWTAARLESLC
ncbi:hypothetical protein JCM19992_33450 [Thermostilla marina]